MSVEIILPPMTEGQTGWNTYIVEEVPVGRDPWPRAHRWLWWLMTILHDRAEATWHWSWRIAQRWAEPPMKYEKRYCKLGTK